MAEVNTPTQVSCRHDGDAVTITLSSTTLMLSLDEAESLHLALQNELIRDLVLLTHGEEIDDTVIVADVPILRSDAWMLSASLENIAFSDEDTDDELDDWSDDETGGGTTCDIQHFDWRIEGF